MAYRREEDDYPVIRPPPMRPPPGRPPPPPRAVHWDDRPSYMEGPPGGGVGRGGVSPPSPRRFIGESPPQRYIEGAPSGYQESPPRRFPGRRPNPPPGQYLSPEDSPPYRYSEAAARRYMGEPSRRPFAEDAPLPDDIDGPPPPGFRDEAARRFGANPAREFQPRRYHSESESPSPPGYFRPPPPPPGGFVDESPRGFGASPRGQFRRYADDDDSPPTRYGDEARRFGGAPRQPYDRSPTSPGYPEDQPRRGRGTSTLPFRDRSPQGFADEPPRRFGGDGSPPTPPRDGPSRGEFAEDIARGGPSRRPPPPGYGRRDTSPPPRFEGGVGPRGEFAEDPARGPPQRPRGPPTGYDRGDTSPPPRFEGGGLPPRVTPGGPPPTRAEDPAGRFAGAPPPRQFADQGPQGPPGYEDNPPQRYATEPKHFVGGPRQFAAATAAAAAGAGAAGLAAYEEGRPARQGPPPGGPSQGPAPSGLAGDAPPRVFGPPPPRQFPDGPPPGPPGPYIGLGTGPQRPEGFPPPPPGSDPVEVPRQGTPARFPPDLLDAAALGALERGRPSLPGSEDSSPPGPALVRYSAADPPALRGTPDSSPADIYGGPRGGPLLGSTSPRVVGLGGRFEHSPEGLGGRFEHSPDIYSALPPHATPPREGYRAPPPGLGQGGDAPLLGVPEGYATPTRAPLGGIGRGGGGIGASPPIPDFLFARPARKHPDGYRARTPPRGLPPGPPRPLERDAIFTAQVLPIELDEKLKEVQPHRGNPGSATGGAWKDIWAGILFLVQIGGISALSIIFGLQGLTHTIKHYGTRNTFHINDWLPQLSAAAVSGAIFAVTWQNLIRLAPVLMILVTIWTGAALMIMVGIVLIATGQTLGLIGIAFFFGGLCQGLYAFVVRERIPFAGEMLKKITSVCDTNPQTYGVSYSVLLVSLGWLAIWIFGFSGSGFHSMHALIMAAWVVSLIWTMQVFRNIVRVTVAGTVSLFYFQEHNMPPMATSLALLRACTSSLGSICFGSLFVPLVEAPCHALRRVNSQAGASEFLFSCVVCFLACLETLIRYFNRLGYIQVAVYGKPFLRASKDTWDMLRAQEVDCLVNDDLTSTILLLSCGIGGSISALVGGIYSFVAHKSLTIIIMVISYLLGALISYIPMAVIESAVATYYVCFAEDPDSLQRYDGPFYERMWVRQMELQAPVNELSD